jgi:hypothetical protein
VTAGIVAEFQGKLSLKSLSVGDPHFGLHARAPRTWVSSSNLGVPGPQVAFERQRDFGMPAETRSDPRPEALEQRELGAIADRVTRGVGAERQVESQDGEPAPICGRLRRWTSPRSNRHSCGYEAPDAAAQVRRLRPAAVRASRCSRPSRRRASCVRRRPRSAGRSRVGICRKHGRGLCTRDRLRVTRAVPTGVRDAIPGPLRPFNRRLVREPLRMTDLDVAAGPLVRHE